MGSWYVLRIAARCWNNIYVCEENSHWKTIIMPGWWPFDVYPCQTVVLRVGVFSDHTPETKQINHFVPTLLVWTFVFAWNFAIESDTWSGAIIVSKVLALYVSLFVVACATLAAKRNIASNSRLLSVWQRQVCQCTVYADRLGHYRKCSMDTYCASQRQAVRQTVWVFLRQTLEYNHNDRLVILRYFIHVKLLSYEWWFWIYNLTLGCEQISLLSPTLKQWWASAIVWQSA